MVMPNYFGWCSNISQTSIRSYSFWCFSSTLYGTDRGRGQVYWGAMKSGRGRGSPVRYWATVVEWTWSHLLPWLHLEWRWLDQHGHWLCSWGKVLKAVSWLCAVPYRRWWPVMTGARWHSAANFIAVRLSRLLLYTCISALFNERGKGEHFLLLHVFLL